MTYCLGIKIRDGLIGLSDGRITSGSQLSAARKVTIMGSGAHRFFIMNSGLRSVRDKTLAYLRRDMAKRSTESFSSMLDAVNAFTHCLRQVAAEDKEALEASKLTFNLRHYRWPVGGRPGTDDVPGLSGRQLDRGGRTHALSVDRRHRLRQANPRPRAALRHVDADRAQAGVSLVRLDPVHWPTSASRSTW